MPRSSGRLVPAGKAFREYGKGLPGNSQGGLFKS
jgi:hypothetical protein